MPHATIQVLAVEDDPVQALALGGLLRGLSYELVGVAATAEEALIRFEQEQPDIVLLDVNLAGSRDGIQLAHDLIRQRPVPLIFLTSYPDQETFARARQVGPFAFLGKPYNGPLLGHSIELALQHFATALGLPADASGSHLPDGSVLLGGVFVREGNRLLKVPFRQLLVAEADHSYLHLHTEGRKHTVRSSLRELEEKLPARQFVRIHRSYLVQISRISAYDYHTVTVGPHVLPLGRAYREEVFGYLEQLR
ncbi:response regulator transcription factor [Hymenobacter lutimineralis]|uniref:Response regulator transcription factor n=1 Tax=Hymenobacter lutimineralis TaxID=2606448 RepID=A0A5D6VG09_9BACT|nr:response regulator transcription factor [Hymenobacter lutimineralis]TYZ14345.1 response regulator transcription factor [Hymenobacter lutimineralis]